MTAERFNEGDHRPDEVVAKVAVAREDLTVYLPDTRGVTVSRWGKGNTKLGPDVYTYSRLPGRIGGTCPGSSMECEYICYAKRVIQTPPVWEVWTRNSQTEDVPETLPPGAKYIRIHVSGDFSSPNYIQQWIALVRRNPDVWFWAYTRSWRVPHLLPDLEELRALPNMQLFASMDKSITEWPPMGWRRAWIEDDPRSNWREEEGDNRMAEDAQPAYVCPEETGRQPHCQACTYCIKGRRGDVIFLLH